MTTIHEFNCEATVRISVHKDAPTDWLTRVSTDDFPYKHHDGGRMTATEGLQMLCDNALRNGVDDASRLDGWGDIDRGMVALRVASANLVGQA